MRRRPTSTPGTSPARKSSPTDCPTVTPYSTMGIEGGIRMPMVDAHTVMPPASSRL